MLLLSFLYLQICTLQSLYLFMLVHIDSSPIIKKKTFFKEFYLYFCTSLALCLAPNCWCLNVSKSSVCSDGCPMAGITGFWDGSSWHWLVGHWHGSLQWALPEQSSIWCPVFAADRGHCGTAEGQGQVPASGCT